MSKQHDITEITVSKGTLAAVVDGRSLSVDLRTLSPTLERASDDELAIFEVSPSGYGIHWPRVDEDISIDGLLGVRHAPSMFKESA
ncbi:DUF2442 domain-containing protein [Thiohalocapsa sp. ML1]|jgi:hypothetical protein|uniref:DUF2442 domain-containing protein n=1 Tax=Thiohalocapsa sp. ML1 TaxID=1431688 RepID=UPI0007323B62|nr:DUF2442 domain-containing protein [Thiohalocapsa sp. ML1]